MWRKWIETLVDAVVPRHPHAALARRADQELLARLMHPRVLERHPWIHTLFPYHDAQVRAVIKAAKYYGESESAAVMARIASDFVLELLAEKSALYGWQHTVVVPIPSSPKRLRERGYNQVELFAKPIAHNLNAAYAPHFLVRAERESQVHVMRSRRRENITGAFTATEAVAGHFIMLIDDVVESGATLTDARRALKEAGAQDVIAVALAH